MGSKLKQNAKHRSNPSQMLSAWRGRLGNACLLLCSQRVHRQQQQCLLQIDRREEAVLETVKATQLPVFRGTAVAAPLPVVLYVCVRELQGGFSEEKTLVCCWPFPLPALLSQPPNQTLFLWLASQKHPGTHHQTPCFIKTYYLCRSSQTAGSH